jgi:phosphohistidine phosphatase SixA
MPHPTRPFNNPLLARFLVAALLAGTALAGTAFPTLAQEEGAMFEPAPSEPASSEPAPAAGPTRVFLVRHAEKRSDGENPRDPHLTEAGQARAEELARVLGESGIEAILSTDFHRTRETAAPIAAATGVEVEITGAGADYAEATARLIRERHAGQTVLVVGHSNTTPALIRALGVAASEIGEIGDDEYDDLFLVVLPPESDAAWLTRWRYGRETP